MFVLLYKTNKIMKIKLSFFIVLLAVFPFTSCENEPLTGTFVDEIGLPTGTGGDSFFVNIDGVEFVEDVITIITVDNGAIEYISIVGSKTGGEQIGFSIPVSHAVGTYNFTEFLEATSVSGTYVVTGSARPAFPGTLTITEKTSTFIAGTFMFTAAPFTGTGATYEMTEGSFSVNY